MAQHTDKIEGQVCIVTGGGRGIGRTIALKLAEADAQVAVVARSEEQLKETVSLAQDVGGRVFALSGDVSNRHDVQRIAQEVEQQFGPVDLLVNNAGVSGPTGPIWDTDLDSWWNCLEINLRGPMMFSNAVLPGMVSHRKGRIIRVCRRVWE